MSLENSRYLAQRRRRTTTGPKHGQYYARCVEGFVRFLRVHTDVGSRRMRGRQARCQRRQVLLTSLLSTSGFLKTHLKQQSSLRFLYRHSVVHSRSCLQRHSYRSFSSLTTQSLWLVSSLVPTNRVWRHSSPSSTPTSVLSFSTHTEISHSYLNEQLVPYAARSFAW